MIALRQNGVTDEDPIPCIPMRDRYSASYILANVSDNNEVLIFDAYKSRMPFEESSIFEYLNEHFNARFVAHHSNRHAGKAIIDDFADVLKFKLMLG